MEETEISIELPSVDGNGDETQVALNIEFECPPANDDKDLDEFVGVFNNTKPKKKRLYICFICGKKFKHNAGRYNHMRNIHEVYPGEKSNIRCLEEGCSFGCSYKEKLQFHLAEQHGIEMAISVKSFNNIQDFLQWKEEFERQEKCRFVKRSGARQREEGVRIAYYYCSRSGTYVSQSTSKTCKKKGTSKSSNHCTASITCIELADGRIQCKICSTHYGHDTDLQHLRLTLTEKYQIAEQLSLGIPREVVLDNLRASAGSDIDKIHLIGLKDIKNIEKSFGVQGVSNEVTNDMIHNLKTWVTTMQQSQYSPVAYFNEEGICNTKTHDITMVLLTVGQVEMIEIFAKKGIFYVATYSIENRLTQCGQVVRPSVIFVTIVMIVDDINEAFPVSFMITNKYNVSKIRVLFDTLKKKVSGISAVALLTDGKEDVYDQWCSVFEERPNHFWSNRFVDRDWRNDLISIADEELQVTIYEKLFSFIESTNTEDLERTIDDYIAELQADANTNRFALSFSSKYLGFERFWAGCFGKQEIVGMNAQLNMELVFNEIEEVTMKKHWDKNYVVKVIQLLLKYVSEKQCSRQTKLQRQMQDLPSHHQLSLSIKLQSIIQQSDTCWRVNSVRDPENIFSLVMERQNGCDSKCAYYCSKCNVCAHKFHCSCQVYAYDKTMCKHIHAVASYKVKKDFDAKGQTSNDAEEGGLNEIKEETKDCEKLIYTQREVWKEVQNSIRKKRKVEEPDSSNPQSTQSSDDLQTQLTKNFKVLKRRGRPCKRLKVKEEVPTHEDEDKTSSSGDVTVDVIEDVILNKRKRGRPKKSEKFGPKKKETETLEKQKVSTKGRRKSSAQNSASDSGNNTKDCNESNESMVTSEPKRVNILRRSKRTC